MIEESGDQKPQIDLGLAIDLDDVKIDFDLDSKLDESMNSVIRVDDDGQSSLDTSIISVIRVCDNDADKESELGDQDSVIEIGKDVEDENLTLSMAQFEMLLSDLKTKHLAEKRMLQCDLALCKKTIKIMANNIRNQGKEKQKN